MTPQELAASFRADARLFVLNLRSFRVSGREPSTVTASDVIRTASLRVMLSHLLVMQAVAEADASTWVVNPPYDCSGVP